MKKTISTILAATFIAGAMGAMPIMAEDNPIVYTYINEAGETVNITQNELNAEHWDKEKLNGENPLVFEDFPASIVENVSEFSELSVYIKYMKNDVDYANLKIIDISDNNVVFETDIANGKVQSPILPLGESYQFKITESVDSVVTEYNKFVNTISESVVMPDYVLNHNTESEQIVLVGNVEDLKASETDDGNGNITIDASAKRFEKVKANELGKYLENLDDDSIYKVYTRDENDNTYLGYINTNGDTDYFYMPTIEVLDWESVNFPQLYTLPSSVTASNVLNATATTISQYKDYSFNLKDSRSKYYQVFKFEVPDIYDDASMHFEFKLNASVSTTVETWLLKSTSSTPVKRNTEVYKSGRASATMIFEAFNVEDARIGDCLYFVVYCANNTSGYGYLSFRPAADEYNDDVCGSVYEVFSTQPSSSVLNMDETLYYYTTTDYRDVDTFYLNYSGTATKRIKFTLNNYKESIEANQRTKYLETYILEPNEDGLPSIGSPGDIYEVPVGKSKQYLFDVSYESQYFMSVSDVPSSNSGSVSFNDLNDKISPCTYAVWSGYRN